MDDKNGAALLEDNKKLGLALSGGGFRASFFHIGVLAQLAHLGLLRQVEVISTVSGGSIIGALYYLHLKRLLEEKTDDEIIDDDYTNIVKRIERDFLQAVQRNLRMMTYCDWRKNWRMAAPDYSRSDRLGELYDEHFYRPLMPAQAGKMIQMKDLYIHPKVDPGPDGQRDLEFRPRKDNGGRKAKVPIILINATALNNGHNWRFEASTMGEPRADDEISLDLDKNLRLQRPPSYDAMIKRQQDFALGYAVAASACVPGIFNPLAVSDLYADIRVELVDGGVHDNQGVQGLIDEENRCNPLIVSDGSGQMRDEDNPHTWLAAVLNRSQGIFMKRIREEQLHHVMQGWSGRVAFFHLRQGLPPRVSPWNAADDAPARGLEKERSFERDPFGVDEKVQELLSNIRTDLDSFTEVEAYSLMLDGYLVSGHVLAQTEALTELACTSRQPKPEDWEFMKIQPWLEKPTAQYRRHLRAAERQFFKVLRLNTPLAAGALGLLALFLWWLVFKSPVADLRIDFSVQSALIMALLAAVGCLLPSVIRSFPSLSFLTRPTRWLAAYLGKAALPVLATFPVRLHLKWIDPLFLRMGQINRLRPPGR